MEADFLASAKRRLNSVLTRRPLTVTPVTGRASVIEVTSHTGACSHDRGNAFSLSFRRDALAVVPLAPPCAP
jgi:hypothetical protein